MKNIGSTNKHLKKRINYSIFSHNLLANSYLSEMENHPNLHLISHPLVQDKLAQLRDAGTNPREFRLLMNEVTALMTYEITSDLAVKAIEVVTPLEKTSGVGVDTQVVLVPVLRAGLGMLDGALNLIPSARVGYIGLYRNEQTLEPVEYYSKFPADLEKSVVILLDPMLATGGSTSAAVRMLKANGAQQIKVLCLVSSPEGVSRMDKDHSDIPVYTASLDRQLNQKGYILPGLGDAGDRLYGTR